MVTCKNSFLMLFGGKKVLIVGLFPNTEKSNVNKVLKRTCEFLESHNVQILIPRNIIKLIDKSFKKYSVDIEEIKEKIDFAITIGGDGTLLNAAHEIAPKEILMCSINIGRIGFLTELELSNLEQGLEKIINGDYKIEERLMLTASVSRNRKVIYNAFALNDIVLAKGGLSRMIKLELYINNEIAAKYPADGLILATSTGSTGYSLSSGGPIVNPNLKVIVITPICSHTLYTRSLIVSEEEKIKVKLQAPHSDIILTVDGQNMYNLMPGDIVTIKKAPFRAKFIKVSDISYYENLRTKIRRRDIDVIF